MFSWSWCCCRDSDAAGSETRVQPEKRPSPLGISDLDLREEEIGGSELRTPRDAVAQRVIQQTTFKKTLNCFYIT